jgi:ABC-type branched-subunit amino acid transport system ATPase component
MAGFGQLEYTACRRFLNRKGDFMEKDKKELLETYQKLDPENKMNVLAHVRVALAAQENALKSMGKKKAPAKAKKSA